MIKESIWTRVREAENIAICGHIRPDGDCIGSCMSMYMYIKKMYPDKNVYVYFEQIQDVFEYISCIDEAITDYRDVNADLFIALDCGDMERLGKAKTYFEKAKHTINIDHHISNQMYAEINHVEPESSSACEVLYELLDEANIDLDIATALYTGIIHDTGVFKYSNTSRRTMEIGGVLLEKGVTADTIIDESFYEKTYEQNLIMGRCMLESKRYLDGQCIVSVATKAMLDEYNVTSSDLDGVVNQLRITKGVKVAVFIYEKDENEYKVSLRANGNVDVNKVAVEFGGGGHVKAAGCMLTGSLCDNMNKLIELIGDQINISMNC